MYNIKQYIDNELYLKTWTQNDIDTFKSRAKEYGKIVGQFMSIINDSNIMFYYENLLHGYINSFWEIMNNQKIYKKISTDNFKTILSNEPHEIHTILRFKNIVTHYKIVVREFLLQYTQSAEILLSLYEATRDFHDKKIFLPDNLTVQDKEDIISKYLDFDKANLNYFKLIQNAKDRNDFKISPKTRLKAKRKYKEESEKFLKKRCNGGLKCGVAVSFSDNADKIKDGYIDDNHTAHYVYSLDFIKQHSDDYPLFRYFKILFEYLDDQDRINLVSKINQMGVMERVFGVHSQNEYRGGIRFNLSEMTSHAQIVAYNKIINDLGNSIENILQIIFTSVFQKRYNFANNARLSIPSSNLSCFEKIRLLAPEFESVLKQYKLFVEDGCIDFDLLQISSQPCTIKDIPSLVVSNKYIYLNEDNKEIVGISNLFFSDQTSLACVEPYEEKHYHTFFDLLANEQVNFSNFEEYQKPQINFLIKKGYISIEDNLVQITNIVRVLILKDLYDNECAAFYHYPLAFQEETKQMANENMIFYGNSLFSKPEQSYFNYFLNKSEFTNGLDLRNSYLHGTQANPDEIQKHEYAYFTYLKLLVLALLKIEDDLTIAQITKNKLFNNK